MFNCYLDLSNLKRFKGMLGFNLPLTNKIGLKRGIWMIVYRKYTVKLGCFRISNKIEYGNI